MNASRNNFPQDVSNLSNTLVTSNSLDILILKSTILSDNNLNLQLSFMSFVRFFITSNKLIFNADAFPSLLMFIFKVIIILLLFCHLALESKIINYFGQNYKT